MSWDRPDGGRWVRIPHGCLRSRRLSSSFAGVAQLVEQMPSKHQVASANLVARFSECQSGPGYNNP